jgi:two-component system, sensor histidine kinase and response regulator
LPLASGFDINRTDQYFVGPLSRRCFPEDSRRLVMQKILVIEDTPDVRDLITDTLKFNGFEAVSAEDGERGVELALSTLPDLILCDVQMPRKDGFQVLADLRGRTATATIPFVFLTGQADKHNMRHGMDLGADDFLAKPFMLQELMAAVTARLKKHKTVTQVSDQKLTQLRDSISLALPHELMTPLNGIIGFSSILMSDYATLSAADIGEFAQHINDSAQRLQRVIENFLLYSQIELTATDPNKLAALRQTDPVTVKDFITGAAQKRANFFKRPSDLSIDLAEACIQVSYPKLDKIVGELIDNAFKFSTAGTPVSVNGKPTDSGYQLAVTDKGRGLTPEQITALGAHMQFERKFYEQQGSGLGFAIARRLTEVHGGALKISSVPGQFTTVEVIFPLWGAS